MAPVRLGQALRQLLQLKKVQQAMEQVQRLVWARQQVLVQQVRLERWQRLPLALQPRVLPQALELELEVRFSLRWNPASSQGDRAQGDRNIQMPRHR
jgi:hypothetical protein